MAQFPGKFKQTARAEQKPDRVFRCGDRVRHAHNPRHVGDVVAVWTHQIRVKWDCGIKEDLHVSEPLMLVSSPSTAPMFWARKRTGPATVVPSPKRKLEAYFASLHERPTTKPVADVEPADLNATIRVVKDRRRRT